MGGRRLYDIAHARAGDKGNRLNIAVFSLRRRGFRGAQRFPDRGARVLAHFAHRGATAVRRYELPKLPALNFVIDDVLEGGVNGSLGLDGHGKSLSFHLLSMPLDPASTE